MDISKKALKEVLSEILVKEWNYQECPMENIASEIISDLLCNDVEAKKNLVKKIIAEASSDQTLTIIR